MKRGWMTMPDTPDKYDRDEWTDLDWAWDELFDDENLVVLDEQVACSLENPDICESCS